MGNRLASKNFSLICEYLNVNLCGIIMKYEKADLPVLISMPRAGSHYVGHYIKQAYLKKGIVGPEKNSTEFFNNEDYRQPLLQKIKLFEDMRDNFGLDMFSIFHGHDMSQHISMPSKPHYTYLFDWFKDFYLGYTVVLLRRKNIWKHFVSFTFHNIIRDELTKFGKENREIHPWHFIDITHDDILKATIQNFNIKFKFTDAHFEKFLYYVRFFNEHVISYYKDRLNVHNLWLEDCGHSTLAGVFLPQDIRLTYENPFKPSKIKYLTYFDNTIEYKAKFTALYDTHFKPYGYEVD